MCLLNIFDGSRRIEAVFFDAAGTLFEVRGSIGEIYTRFARHYGIDSEPGEIQKAFTNCFRAQPPLAFPSGTPEKELNRLERNWWRNLVKCVFSGYFFPQFDELFSDLFEYFRSREAWYLYDDVVPVLTNLKDNGLRLAVISNFDSRLYELLKVFEIDRFFDGMHISSRIGAAKPDAAIFQAALRQQGVPAERAVHVGDSWREDVEGARSAGIKPVLLERSGDVTVIDELIIINRLDQLIEGLNKIIGA